MNIKNCLVFRLQSMRNDALQYLDRCNYDGTPLYFKQMRIYANKCSLIGLVGENVNLAKYRLDKMARSINKKKSRLLGLSLNAILIDGLTVIIHQISAL